MEETNKTLVGYTEIENVENVFNNLMEWDKAKFIRKYFKKYIAPEDIANDVYYAQEVLQHCDSDDLIDATVEQCNHHSILLNMPYSSITSYVSSKGDNEETTLEDFTQQEILEYVANNCTMDDIADVMGFDAISDYVLNGSNNVDPYDEY